MRVIVDRVSQSRNDLSLAVTFPMAAADAVVRRMHHGRSWRRTCIVDSSRIFDRREEEEKNCRWLEEFAGSEGETWPIIYFSLLPFSLSALDEI